MFTILNKYKIKSINNHQPPNQASSPSTINLLIGEERCGVWMVDELIEESSNSQIKPNEFKWKWKKFIEFEWMALAWLALVLALLFWRPRRQLWAPRPSNAAGLHSNWINSISISPPLFILFKCRKRARRASLIVFLSLINSRKRKARGSEVEFVGPKTT